jgi:hypothetical protein
MSTSDDELRDVDAPPAARPDVEARATIHRALDYCQELVRHPSMDKDTKAMLGIAGVGALSLFALRGSVELADEIKERYQPRGTELDDVEALARVIESEASTHTLREQVAVAWAVRNRAHAHKRSIAQLVCTPTCGHQGKHRPFSSARPATDLARDIAAAVLRAPEAQDPTHGAIAILEPALYAREYLDGKHRLSLDELRAEWRKRDHLQPVGTVGRWELWRHA